MCTSTSAANHLPSICTLVVLLTVAMAAVATGQQFTDDPIRPGVTVVKRLHITELRERIDGLRGAHGLSAFPWSDRAITAGSTPVRALHLTELRRALDAAYAAAGRLRPAYTDNVLLPGVTPIRAAHINELRRGVEALEGPGNACPVTSLGRLSGTVTRTGRWSSDCASANRTGRYARFYSFTLAQAGDVQIDLESSQDSYLYLLNGSGTGGTIVTSNDDSGTGNNARITQRLAAGTYTVEATTFGSGRTGSFTLTVAASGGGSTCPVTSLGSLSGTVTRTGGWSPDCASVNRTGRYARFYSFTLAQAGDVQIDLESSQDSYLYLLNGSGTGGTIVTSNDDSGSGNNARITRRLAAGTYTIEATTYSVRTGNFTLKVEVSGSSTCPVSSLGLLSRSVTRSSTWSSSCASVNRTDRYARFYSFTLAQARDVQIDLESAQDSYLYLLRGAGTAGTVLVGNDDGGSRYNARITRRLDAGTYTIEATTFSRRQTGSFTLRVAASGGGDGGTCLLSSLGRVSGAVTRNGTWGNACASVNRTGRYARYYSFELDQAGNVQIDLESSTDPYLLLLEGSGTDGRVVTWNDDRGSSINSRITRRLDAGTYTIEATTYAPARTGSFTLRVTGSGVPCSITTVGRLSGTVTRTGTWSSACASGRRAGRYARYYSFTLDRARDVRIDLESSTDSYLFLLNGARTDGSVVTSNDDGGSGYNARITRRLGAGTYTVEVTTYAAGRTGSFGLRLSASGGGACSVTSLGQASGRITRTGTWSSSCISERREDRYARYYSFTLGRTGEVRIDLESQTDSYLYLLNGSGTRGAVLAGNDDGGAGRNARIARRLAAGTYTIEATTFGRRASGSFTLTVTPLAADASCLTSLGRLSGTVTQTGTWSSACVSARRAGRYARYYSFTLDRARDVRIDLESSTDSYLFLLNGARTNGSVVTSNDDGGSGTNARITRRLGAGTYTVEATTYASGRTGSFRLSVFADASQ